MTEQPDTVPGEVVAVTDSDLTTIQRAMQALAFSDHARPHDDRHVPAVLPPPDVLRRFFRDGIDTWYGRQVQGRTVHLPEDTYPNQRRLADAHEVLGEYAAVFKSAADRVRACQEMELTAAVGTVSEADDTPAGSVTVPDGRGDIRLYPAYINTWTIDLDQVVAAVVEEALLELVQPVEFNGAEDGILEDVARPAVQAAINILLSLGKFDPQVSKVRAWRDFLSRRGGDQEASVVNSAIGKTTKYTGIKVERKAAK